MVRLSYVQLDWNHEICSFFQLTDAVLFYYYLILVLILMIFYLYF